MESEVPTFKPRKRGPGHQLPNHAFKILAAPEVGNNLYANVLDWVALRDESQKLALALQDTIYLLDPLVKNSPMVAIDFNKGSKNVEQEVHSISFDRLGEALAAGGTESLVSIFDGESGKRLRNLSCHSSVVSAIAWNRSMQLPYLIATGSADESIIFHDVRQKMSIVTQIRNLGGPITKLSWSCQSEFSDLREMHLASAIAPSVVQGKLAIWNTNDILRGKKIKPLFLDEVSHQSPIKAFCWNQLKPGMFATGGSTTEDSVIRLYDINSLSE